MEPQKQGLVFLAGGLVLLLVGAGLFVAAGDGVERNCFAYVFCDTYDGAGAGAAHAFGLMFMPVGGISVVWGMLVYFLAPRILAQAAD